MECFRCSMVELIEDDRRRLEGTEEVNVDVEAGCE
jgi:hypothetical protein